MSIPKVLHSKNNQPLMQKVQSNALASKVNKYILIAGVFAAVAIVSGLVGTLAMHHVITMSLANSEFLIGLATATLAVGSLALVKGLWDTQHRVINVDPKEFGVSGIRNHNNNCWLNSLLQMFLNIPAIKTLLESDANFQNFIRDYDNSVAGTGSPDSNPIRRFLSRHVRDIQEGPRFQDTHEPLVYILDRLKSRDNNLRNSLITINHFEHTDGRVERSRRPVEPNTGIINLPITRTNNANILDLFASYFRSEQDVEVRDTRTVQVERGRQDWLGWALRRRETVQEDVEIGRKRLILEDRKLSFSPNNLFVNLQRYLVNPQVEVPFRLDLPREYFDNDRPASYDLKSFAINLSQIHYVSYVNKAGVWFRCDDNRVQAISNIEAQRQARNAYVVHYERA